MARRHATKHCSYCASDWILYRPSVRRMVCGNCGAQGPAGVNQVTALEAWDARPIEDDLELRIENLKVEMEFRAKAPAAR